MMNKITNSINLSTVTNNNFTSKVSNKNSVSKQPNFSGNIDCSVSDIYKKNPMYNVAFKGQMNPDVEGSILNIQLNLATKSIGQRPSLKVLIDAEADMINAKKSDTIGKTIYNISAQLVENGKLGNTPEDKQIITKEFAMGFITGLYETYCGAEPANIKSMEALDTAVKNKDTTYINSIAKQFSDVTTKAILENKSLLQNAGKEMSPQEKESLANIVIE